MFLHIIILAIGFFILGYAFGRISTPEQIKQAKDHPPRKR